MSSVTVSRDSDRSRARATKLSGDINNSTIKRNQTSTRLASAKSKGAWCSSTALGSASDTVSSNTTGSSFAETFRRGRASRKAPLPAAARARAGTRNLPRRADPPCTPERDDGWEADTEDTGPVVSAFKSTPVSKPARVPSVPDKTRVAEARKVLEECGVLGSQSTSAHFAALSDADSSLSPPSASNTLESSRTATAQVAKKEPSMGELRDSISMLQKQVADLRSEVPQVTANPLRDEVEMNRRAIEGSSAPLGQVAGASSFSVGGMSGGLSHTSSAFAASTEFGNAGLQNVKPKKRPDSRARKVPLPADLMAGRPGGVSGAIAAGRSSSIMHSGALSRALAEESEDDGNASDSSASSFGLSCGLPGLSNEVADTITHLSAAETIQASVTVTPLSLKDWLLRPVPTPMDPSLTLYGAAVHNAHVACCEVVIGGLLSAIEAGSMERPSGLPSGSYDFRSRGISDQEALQSVLRSLANWMKMLEEQNAGSGPLAPADSPLAGRGAQRDSVTDGPILQDPRAGPLLSVLRSEALRIIGEEEEDMLGMAARRAAHLNSTDMLHVLTTALVPSFRQLVSRSADEAAAEQQAQNAQHLGSPEQAETLGTSKSSSSLFSLPAGPVEKGTDSPEQTQDATSAAEAYAAGQIAATGMRPDNPCDSEGLESESIAVNGSPEPAAPATPAEAEKKPLRTSTRSLAPLNFVNMKNAPESIAGDPCEEDMGPEDSAKMGSPMSHTGSINPDAITDALRKLMVAGAEDGSEGIEEVDVVEMLRQLAAERVAAKKRQSEGSGKGAASVHSSPNHAAAGPDTTSNSTAPSSASDATSQPRSGANSEGSSTTAKEKQHSERETEQLQAAELEKLLQNPAVMQMISQIAGKKMGGMTPEQIQMQQQQAARHAAQERERAMRYEMQIAAQQQQQRMMMNTFVNMNMMQNQMANAMFSSMMNQPQQQSKAGVEKFAMLRSMAARHGVRELTNMPLKQGASAMMGQSMMAPPMAPGMSMMAPPPPKPRMQTPINRFASSISMPYLQVGGQTPLPQNAPAPAATSAAATPAATTSMAAASSSNTDASGSTVAAVPAPSPRPPAASQSAPNLPTATPTHSSGSVSRHGSLPTPEAHRQGSLPTPEASGSGTSTSGSSSKKERSSSHASHASDGKLRPSSGYSYSRGSSRSQKLPGSSSHHGKHGHPMQSHSMMAPHVDSRGGSMMNGMMPQHGMGYPHQKSASYMPGMGGSMMGGSLMGGMANSGPINGMGNSAPLHNGMMPQGGGSYMGGMRSNSFMGGHSGQLNGVMPQHSGSFMGGMQPGHMGMGMHPGMHNPYGGMPVQRSTSLPHGQGHRSGHHASHGASHSHGGPGHSSLSRHRAQAHQSAGMLGTQPHPQHMPSGHRHEAAPSPYHSSSQPQPNHGSSKSGEQLSSSRAHGSSRRKHVDPAHQSSSNGSSQTRSASNGDCMSPGVERHASMPRKSNVPADPPPMYGELLSSIDSTGSFLFDSAGSQQPPAAPSKPSASSKTKPQRPYKHLGTRSGRRSGPQLEATPEGDDESVMAGDSQILL